MIQVKELTKRYGNHIAVDHLSFTVEKGEICGLLGPNGAGKSTTMNMMTGYISATDGTALIDGSDIFDEPRAARAKIGYLPEQPPVYPDMTPWEYLLFVAQLKAPAWLCQETGDRIGLASLQFSRHSIPFVRREG